MTKLDSDRCADSAPVPVRRIQLTPHAGTPQDGGGDELYWISTRDKYLIRDFRHVMRENQTAFWRRFGVSQTRGSRFERGNVMPLPVLMLMRLYLRRVIDDDDLLRVRSSDDGGDGPL